MCVVRGTFCCHVLLICQHDPVQGSLDLVPVATISKSPLAGDEVLHLFLREPMDVGVKEVNKVLDIPTLVLNC